MDLIERIVFPNKVERLKWQIGCDEVHCLGEYSYVATLNNMISFSTALYDRHVFRGLTFLGLCRQTRYTHEDFQAAKTILASFVKDCDLGSFSWCGIYTTHNRYYLVIVSGLSDDAYDTFSKARFDTIAQAYEHVSFYRDFARIHRQNILTQLATAMRENVVCGQLHEHMLDDFVFTSPDTCIRYMHASVDGIVLSGPLDNICIPFDKTVTESQTMETDVESSVHFERVVWENSHALNRLAMTTFTPHFIKYEHMSLMPWCVRVTMQDRLLRTRNGTRMDG